MIPELDLDSLFDSQPQTQTDEYKLLYPIVREGFKAAAVRVTELLPSNSPERTLAIRHIWYAMMVTNSALSRGLR